MNLEDLLVPLREQIDRTDQEIIKLIKKRVDIVKEIGRAKQKFDAPVFVPEREKALLEKSRNIAIKNGLNPDLITDIQRRLIAESHIIEDAIQLVQTPKTICVVGGGAGIGARLVQEFNTYDYKSNILEVNDWDRAQELLNTDVVIVSVPIHSTIKVINQLKPYLKPNQLLADFTSVKQESVNAMLEVHKGPVLGLHPMFGPDVHSLHKQVMLVSGGRDFEQSEWLVKLFKSWKMMCENIAPAEHDKYMAHIQAARHFNSYVIGKFIQSHNLDIDLLRRISSPIYYLDLSLIGRLFAQKPELYADIIFDREENKETIKSLFTEYNDAIRLIDQHDKQGFIDKFNDIKEFFGSEAERFLAESARFIYSSTHSRNK